MKLPVVIFVLLLGMCATLTMCVLTPEPDLSAIASEAGDGGLQAQQAHGADGEDLATRSWVRGYPHPQHRAMQKGDPGPVRYRPIRWAGWAFSLLMITFFVCVLALGGRKQGRLGPLTIPLMCGYVIYLASMIAMLLAYERFMEQPAPPMWGGFPIPTAIMMYAVWPAPMVFVLTYIWMFDRWTFQPRDATRFEELLRQCDAIEQESQ